jgi:hypothetical protein
MNASTQPGEQAMQVNDEMIAIARAACLFGAEKYRRAADLGDRLGDNAIKNKAEDGEKVLLEVANALPVLPDHYIGRVTLALDAMIGEMNKQSHTLTTRGALGDAGLYEHKLREAYALRRALTS